MNLTFTGFNDKVQEYIRYQRTNRSPAEYMRILRNEFRVMKPYLNKSIRNVLDIGCGLGSINVLLNRYLPAVETFHLLDRSLVEDGKLFGGWGHEGVFYNSLDVAKEFLTTNGVSVEKLHIIEANEKKTIDVPDDNVDLLISLLSWGFHYPLEYYLDEVERVISDECIWILDIRNHSNQENTLEKRGYDLEILEESTKRNRYLVKKR